MANRGKSINLFLLDGEPSGIIKCTIANWTGVAYKIPRTALDQCKNRSDLKQSGVYFLFGTSDETGKGVVYVGQARARKNGGGILMRLQEHKRNSKKDYWTEAVVFITSDNSFGPTEISYLENRFCNLALQANRYDVKNETDPAFGNFTEEKESEMEEFVDNAIVIMGTLGHKLFEPINKRPVDRQTSADASDQTTLYLERTIKNIGKVEASGCQTTDGFVVFAGSRLSLEDDKTVPMTIRDRKKKAPIRKEGKFGILQEDMLFTSPTYAAVFVIGKSENGLTRWRTETGTTLKELESADCDN